MIAVISYLSMEALTEHMPGDSMILKQLTETPRKKDSFTVVEDLSKMFIDEPPSHWS
jgi:hypothetical protein